MSLLSNLISRQLLNPITGQPYHSNHTPGILILQRKRDTNWRYRLSSLSLDSNPRKSGAISKLIPSFNSILRASTSLGNDMEVESDAENVYDDPFDSKGEKIKESKLLIDELDLPCAFFLLLNMTRLSLSIFPGLMLCPQPTMRISTTYSSNSFLEEFTDELALITYPSKYDDNLQFDIESDLKQIEFLLYQDKDSSLKDSIDQKGLANLDAIFVDLIPDIEDVYSSTDVDVPSQQELDMLFGPLYDEFFNAGSNPLMNIQSTSASSTHTNVHAEENNNDQEEEGEHVPDDEFTNPLCTPIQEVAETSSHNIGNSNVSTFNQPQVFEYRWTKDHPLEQVRRNQSRPVQTRRQLTTDPEMCMYALTVSTAEPKNIKEAMANSTWIEAMQDELHQFDRLQVWELVDKPFGKLIIRLK
nr:hypothetical protein [Tanacetum cinerariifolium]